VGDCLGLEVVEQAIERLGLENWSGWYKSAVPLAEERYNRWLDGEYDEERT
jgi:hypothetical protein